MTNVLTLRVERVVKNVEYVAQRCVTLKHFAALKPDFQKQLLHDEYRLAEMEIERMSLTDTTGGA